MVLVSIYIYIYILSCYSVELSVLKTNADFLSLIINSFLLGFVFPPLWYYATFLYFGNYYRRDPRERAGLAASAITVSTTHMHIIYYMVRDQIIY